MRKKKGYLAGNSVWQDRAFLCQDMPSITDYLHYRLLDVTSIKIAINNCPEQRDMEDKNRIGIVRLIILKNQLMSLNFIASIFLNRKV